MTYTYMMRCRWCGTVHDASKVEVVQRYTDCSVWQCPGCKVLIDDRPPSWGGSATRVETDSPEVIREHHRADLYAAIRHGTLMAAEALEETR